MVRKIKSWLNILFLTVVLIAPGLVFATTPNNEGLTQTEGYLKASPIERLNNAAQNNGPYTTTANEFTLANILGVVINVALSALGVIFIFIVILSGYKWMTAEGSEDEVKKAKESMTRATIGLVVVLSSYAIWTFIKTFFITQI